MPHVIVSDEKSVDIHNHDRDHRTGWADCEGVSHGRSRT